MSGGRIEARFAELKAEGRAGLITYLSAGDPDRGHSLAMVNGLPAAGADLIELGMPFTDPMADGPSIQASGLRALQAGATMIQTLEIVRDFRLQDEATPIVLMGYYNPIHAYGRSMRRIANAGENRNSRMSLGSSMRPPGMGLNALLKSTSSNNVDCSPATTSNVKFNLIPV